MMKQRKRQRQRPPLPLLGIQLLLLLQLPRSITSRTRNHDGKRSIPPRQDDTPSFPLSSSDNHHHHRFHQVEKIPSLFQYCHTDGISAIRGGGDSNEDLEESSGSVTTRERSESLLPPIGFVTDVFDDELKNAVGDPNGNSSDDASDDDSELSFPEDDGRVRKKVESRPAEIPVVLASAEVDLEQGENKSDGLDSFLVEAFAPLVHLPPSLETLSRIREGAGKTEVVSRKRLDRRTLYHLLLLELSPLPSPMGGDDQADVEGTRRGSSKRKFLEEGTSRSILSMMSLAGQPRWRRHLRLSKKEEQEWWWKGGVRLYNDDDNDDDDDEDDGSDGGATLAMQETMAMALAHSLGSGMVLIDDSSLNAVRQTLSNDHDIDCKPVELLNHLIRLANSGKFYRGGKLSSLMERDLEMQRDDPTDEYGREILEMQRADEEKDELDANVGHEDSLQHVPLPLVLFLRTDSCPSILRSKSTVEMLAKETQDENSIHMLMMGGGKLSDPHVSFKKQSAPSRQQQNMDPSSMQMPSMNDPWNGNSQQQQQPNPFFMNTSPSNNPMAYNAQNTPPNLSHLSFGPNNSASGLNDPEGSRRFNIFLAQTTDADGNPGIMGAIAPPQAGNLFPRMFSYRQREKNKNNPNTEEEPVDPNDYPGQMQEMFPGIQPPSFNATVTTFRNMNPNNQDEASSNFQRNNHPYLSQMMQKVIHQAMTNVIDRLASMQPSEEDSVPEGLSSFSRAFAQVLSNDELKSGITDNLARAAPALVDPNCQGVMLSVCVPPTTGLNNQEGGAVGGSSNSASTIALARQGSNKRNEGHHNHVGGWLHKILNRKEEDNDKESKSEKISSRKHQLSNAQQLRKEIGAQVSSRIQQQQQQRRLSDAQQLRNEIKRRTVNAIQNSDSIGGKSRITPNNNNNGKSSRPKKVASTPESKQQRGRLRLQSLCRAIPLPPPSDPVRSRAWEGWRLRERGSLLFKKNTRVLKRQLRRLNLMLIQSGDDESAMLRGMLSVRDLEEEMEEVVEKAVEVEARKSQRMRESPWAMNNKESNETSLPPITPLSPNSISAAITLVCRIPPSNSILSSATTPPPPTFRSRDEIASLAQDKHERALLSQVISPQDIGVTYDMVGGLSHVKELLRQSITYPLKFPHLYSEGIAREAVKGVLLFGPPGTGKTMLAKAVATEGGATFLSVDASSVENKWLGESEKNAKAVFTLARRLAPCVIFMDEVDSLLSSREGGGSDDSASGTLTSVKTTMMSEWDGLNSGTNGVGGGGGSVIVIGSTNRPFDLDEAVLRRFPRRILVDLPDLETRADILEVTMAENRLDPHVNMTRIAERLEGYTGSDIKEVCREAVVQISHEQARLLDLGGLAEEGGAGTVSQDASTSQRLRPVTMRDFERALNKLKKSVSEKGRELARVWEWNDEYGEVKRKNKRDNSPQLMNMFL